MESKKERLENLLLEFVERATKKEATAEELEALPDVAYTLAILLLNL